jgi:Ca2+-binding RTX toxin-like protein
MKGFGIALVAAVSLVFVSSAWAAVIYGDSGNNTLEGTPNNDQIYGRAGDDTIYGHGNQDLLEGDDGGDQLNGGPGNDDLRGGDGPDWMFGGIDNDDLIGGEGQDTLFGEGGDDGFETMGDYKADYVDGGGGYDVCFVGEQDTYLNCEVVHVYPL